MSDSSSSPVEVPPEALVHVGYVFRPHGVRGEMKVDPEATDNPHRFETFSTVYIGHDPSHVRRCDVESVRFQETKRGTTVILRLGGVDDRNEAERLAKRNVYVHEDDLDLDTHEVFIHDLIGLTAVMEDGTPIGTVTALLQSPGQDVFVIERPNDEEALVPAVAPFVVDLDVDAARVVIRPIEGLL